jgi:hypothetical protein
MSGAAPAPSEVAFYLAAKRPLDRARKRSRPIRVTIAPPRTPAEYVTPVSGKETHLAEGVSDGLSAVELVSRCELLCLRLD